MRAFKVDRFGEQPHVGTLPEPECGPDEVLMDVACAGLNYADLLLAEGQYQVLPDLPAAVGFEAAGTITAVGSDVTTHAVGDRVVSLGFGGALAEQRACKASQVFEVPEGMSFREAAGWYTPYTTAYHALVYRGELKPGDALLVLGASGGVGQATVALGAALGAQVIAAVSTEVKADAALALGAHHTIRYDQESLSGRVREITNGRGADVVFDPVGGDHFRDAVRATAFLGRLLIVGFASGAIPEIPMNLPLVKGLSLIGVDMGRFIRERPDEAAESHRELIAMTQRYRLPDLVTRVVPLDDLEGIHAEFTSRSVIGKWIAEI